MSACSASTLWGGVRNVSADVSTRRGKVSMLLMAASVAATLYHIANDEGVAAPPQPGVKPRLVPDSHKGLDGILRSANVLISSPERSRVQWAYAMRAAVQGRC